MLGRGWLDSLRSMRDEEDPSDPETRLTQFERNLLRDLEALLDETGETAAYSLPEAGLKA